MQHFQGVSTAGTREQLPMFVVELPATGRSRL